MKINEKYKGIFYIILAALGFALMNLFVKLAGDLPAIEKSFFRNLVAFIFAAVILIRQKGSFLPSAKAILHGGRKKLFPDRRSECG